VDDPSGLRLFSTGGGTEVLEWDLVKGTIKRSLASQGGTIWSIAANPMSNRLALGCEDGCIRLVLVEEDEFRIEKRFDRVKTRLLSLAWGPPRLRQKQKQNQSQKNPPRPSNSDEDESDEAKQTSDEEDEDVWEDSWIVSGCADSSLRKWDVHMGRVLERMTTDRTRGERTLVWAVGVLS
jgi:U3 small nucleolar RNA-associated protein 4